VQQPLHDDLNRIYESSSPPTEHLYQHTVSPQLSNHQVVPFYHQRHPKYRILDEDLGDAGDTVGSKESKCSAETGQSGHVVPEELLEGPVRFIQSQGIRITVFEFLGDGGDATVAEGAA
jgi:hypothetical protein